MSTAYAASLLFLAFTLSLSVFAQTAKGVSGVAIRWGTVKAFTAPNTIDPAKAGTSGHYSPPNAAATVYFGAFGGVCNGSTDDTPAFVALTDYLNRHNNTRVIFPPNSKCIVGYLYPFVNSGSAPLNYQLVGNNTTIINTAASSDNPINLNLGGNDFRCVAYTGSTMKINYDDYTASPINAASAGDTKVTVTVPSSVAAWRAGDQVLIYGFDQQQRGYPPNYRYFDRTTIVSVNSLTGVVTLVQPLQFSYNPAWPFYAPAKTTIPSIRNRTRACPSGGTLNITGSVYVEGLDLSQSAGSFEGGLSGGAYNFTVKNSKLGYLSPSEGNIFTITNSTIGNAQPDKMANAYISKSNVYEGSLSLDSAVGFNYLESDGDVFMGNPIVSAKNNVFNNPKLHGPINYGAIASNFFYSQTFVVNNPVYYPGRTTSGALFGKNASRTITTLTVPTLNTFTISAGDLNPSEIGLGADMLIRDHATQAILGSITDVYLVSGIPTVSGTWSGTISARQKLDYSPNPRHVVINNPTVVGQNAGGFPAVFNNYGLIDHGNIQFTEPTTVSELGKCNAQGTTSKVVRDATSYSLLGSGGGAVMATVICDPNTLTWQILKR